jgi:hypothetical protein
MASDYSYAAEDIGKLNYRIVGDSAGMLQLLGRMEYPHPLILLLSKAFIDPLFSSGVHLAFLGGLSAALSVISVIDGTADENTAAEFHSVAVKTAYTRYLL